MRPHRRRPFRPGRRPFFRPRPRGLFGWRPLGWGWFILPALLSIGCLLMVLLPLLLGPGPRW